MCVCVYLYITIGGISNSLFFQEERQFNSTIDIKKFIISQWTEILSLPYTYIYVHMHIYSQTYSVVYYSIFCFTNLYMLSQYYLLGYFSFKIIVNHFNIRPSTKISCNSYINLRSTVTFLLSCYQEHGKSFL